MCHFLLSQRTFDRWVSGEISYGYVLLMYVFFTLIRFVILICRNIVPIRVADEAEVFASPSKRHPFLIPQRHVCASCVGAVPCSSPIRHSHLFPTNDNIPNSPTLGVPRRDPRLFRGWLDCPAAGGWIPPEGPCHGDCTVADAVPAPSPRRNGSSLGRTGDGENATHERPP